MAQTNIAFYFPFNQSLTGGPRTLLTFMDLIDRNKYNPLVITQKPSPLVEELHKRNVEVLIVPLPELLQPQDRQVLDYGWIKMFRSLGQLVSYNRSLMAILKKRRIDIVWARNVKGVLFVGLASRLLRKILIWDVALGEEFKGLVKILHFIGLNMANVVVTEARSQHQNVFGSFLPKLYPKKLKTITPGIGLDRIRDLESLSSELVSDDRLFTIISVATISPRKNQKMLLLAVEKLIKMHPNIRVNIVGIPTDEEYYQNLQSYISESNLGSVVHFLGWRTDIPALMKQADVLVLTSRNEGIPHVIYEAMYTGLPVVATAVGGIPDAIIDSETGYLVDPDDIEKTVSRLAFLIKNPDKLRSIGKNAENYALQHFTSEKYYERYDKLLTNLASS